jgi:hypothetical protein
MNVISTRILPSSIVLFIMMMMMKEKTQTHQPPTHPPNSVPISAASAYPITLDIGTTSLFYQLAYTHHTSSVTIHLSHHQGTI